MKLHGGKGRLILSLCAAAVIFFAGFFAREWWMSKKNEDLFGSKDPPAAVTFAKDGYELDQVLMVSRHNLRSPLSDGDSLLEQITPHEWFDWTSGAGDLSLKGGLLETDMGQFFRQYLEAKGLIPKNWRPEAGETRFYANGFQRTIATAGFFARGLLPVGDAEIETRSDYGVVDLNFVPFIRDNDPDIEARVLSEIAALGGAQGLAGITANLKESFALLERVLDFKDSAYAMENGLQSIPLDDLKVTVDHKGGICISGGLEIANTAAEALMLQICEEEDPDKALFGHRLTEEEFMKIREINDVYRNIKHSAPTLAARSMLPLIEEMKKEFETEGRCFTYFSGHDSTQTALISVLRIKDYSVPGTIGGKTPIGGKLMFEKYRGPDGKEYFKLFMCCHTTAQLRNLTMTSLDHPPVFCELELEGMTKNADGYYALEDLLRRFDEVSEFAEDPLGKEKREVS